MEVLGLEKGDYVEVELEKNQILLKPRKMLDPTQGWYWTRKGQKIEREVDREIEKGEPSPAFKKKKRALNG
jgi:antitoxin component of MazEF toxin-antitoxin module